MGCEFLRLSVFVEGFVVLRLGVEVKVFLRLGF